MYRLLVMLTIIVACVELHAQDIIIKRDGKEIPSKVLEISSTEIRYKDFDFLSGPTRVLPISQVVVILYENGKREVFSSKDEEVKEQPEYNDKASFLVGAGVGNSYGLPGIRFQFNTAKEDRFGFHAGIGLFPKIDFIVAAGVKYYVFKDVYLNAQFGTLGYNQRSFIETSSIHTTIEALYGPSFYGPSLLIGGDWAWDISQSFGLGINAGLGMSYEVSTIQEFVPAIDLGVIFKFY
ncbi:MAG: hypothetical protein J0M05_01015 [Candidatus Kapabacteria bacterium]|nr:hypothetical protein [Candidatus Kapabacteria bacterium]